MERSNPSLWPTLLSRITVAAASLLMLYSACEKGNDPGGEIRSIDLSVGSAWTYRWHVEQYSSAGALVWDTTSRFIVFVSAINQAVGPYQGLTLVEARDLDQISGTTEVWYSQTNNRLVEVAYRSAGRTPVILPKGINRTPGRIPPGLSLSPFVQPYALQLMNLEVPLSDSIQIRDDPRVVYLYPLTGGSSWVSFTSPFLQERTVEDYEETVVPAGQYHCARIRTTIPSIDPDFAFFDFVSSEGLAKRVFDEWIQIADPSGIPVADSLRILESLELQAH